MAERLRLFRSPEFAARFDESYQAVLKQWPVYYEELYIPTRFGDTYMIASGPMRAFPIVLLPPGGGQAPIWIRNVGPLSQSYRVYAVDIIGELNRSVPTRPIHGHREFMDWMIDLFNGLQIESSNLVGNSNGGFFALETALNFPERVKKVVLISPAATFVQMWTWWWHLLIPAHMIAPLIGSQRMIHRAYAWLWQDFPMETHFAELRAISKVAGARYRPSINSAVPRVFHDAELRRIRTPVLLLIGDHEVIYRPENAIRRANRLVSGLKAAMVPNANHSAQYTAPEFVNIKILEFLADHEAVGDTAQADDERGRL
jgi:pimeloyl-ACP methyl ester carboxylesterase